jgi:hypothetical protein
MRFNMAGPLATMDLSTEYKTPASWQYDEVTGDRQEGALKWFNRAKPQASGRNFFSGKRLENHWMRAI